MQSISYIFFVSEVEYPKLQTACPGDFPFTYPQFVSRVNETIEQIASTATAIKAYARVEEFLTWCAQTKVQPNNTARAQYAIIIGNAKKLH